MPSLALSKQRAIAHSARAPGGRSIAPVRSTISSSRSSVGALVVASPPLHISARARSRSLLRPPRASLALPAVLEAIKTHAKRHRRLALVGHEPDLGELAARLLGARGSVQFKKGAICAIDVDGATPGGPGTLRWLLTPKALRALAP